MDDRKAFLEIFNDKWILMEGTGYGSLGERQWGKFLDNGEKLMKKYREYSADQEELFRGIYAAVQNFYKRKNTEDEK